MVYNAKEKIFCCVHVCSDNNVLASGGHALIGPLICFVNFVYRTIACQKMPEKINFGIEALGVSACCQIQNDSFHIAEFVSSGIQLVIDGTFHK